MNSSTPVHLEILDPDDTPEVVQNNNNNNNNNNQKNNNSESDEEDEESNSSLENGVKKKKKKKRGEKPQKPKRTPEDKLLEILLVRPIDDLPFFIISNIPEI